jgi:hypothetical protein
LGTRPFDKPLSDENPNIADADGAPISDLSDSGR